MNQASTRRTFLQAVMHCPGHHTEWYVRLLGWQHHAWSGAWSCPPLADNARWGYLVYTVAVERPDGDPRGERRRRRRWYPTTKADMLVAREEAFREFQTRAAENEGLFFQDVTPRTRGFPVPYLLSTPPEGMPRVEFSKTGE